MTSVPLATPLEHPATGFHGRDSLAPSDVTRTHSPTVLDSRGEKVYQDEALLNEPEKITPFAVIICLIASMGGFVFGFDVSIKGKASQRELT